MRYPVLETDMGSLSSWVDSHFNLVQTIGIMGGLLTSAAALFLNAVASNREAKARNAEAKARLEEAESGRRESKAKEVENLLTNVSQQRDLWTNAYMRPELVRLFQDNVDLSKKPISVVEKECLNQILVQYQVTWCMAEAGGIVTLDVLARDAGDFFSRPLPRAVWEDVKGVINPRFVEFMERALESSGHLQGKS